MPRMHCMGTSLVIPENGKICPNLPTNLVPMGTKCEIVCNSGSANLEYVKCEKEGWSNNEVICAGTPTGLIVGLMVGGLFAVCIIAYIYAKVKTKRQNKKDGKVQNKPVSRAAKIAANNDMVVTGVVSPHMAKAGMAAPPYRPKGKLVTVEAEEEFTHRNSSNSSRNLSNPPSYHSNEDDGRNYDKNSRSSKQSRRSRNSSTEQQQQSQVQRKPRSYYNEYTEEVDLGYQDQPTMVPDGHFQSTQDTGPMYPDYYGPGSNVDRRYGAVDHSYYGHDMYKYANDGMDNMGYSQEASYNQKPYHVPI